jgi:hypothetical protein
VIFVTAVVQAQLSVIIMPLKIGVQKVVVPLKLKNNLANKVESARAVCFLLDERGSMIAESTKWVIGQKMAALDPQAETTFNFIVTGRQPFLTTNLTAKISFTRLMLATNIVGNVKRDINITTLTK